MQRSLWRQTRNRPIPPTCSVACKRSRFGLKRGKKAQCVSNRCKDLFKRKKYFGVMGTLRQQLAKRWEGKERKTVSHDQAWDWHPDSYPGSPFSLRKLRFLALSQTQPAEKRPQNIENETKIQPRPQGSLLSCAGNRDPWPGPTTFRFWIAL